MSQEDYSEVAMVAYPYVFPHGPSNDLPIDYEIDGHSTLIYLGNIEDIESSPKEILSALRPLKFYSTDTVPTNGLSLFGPERTILVMCLTSPHLIQNYNLVSSTLHKIGVYNASEFRYNPHITLNYDYHGESAPFNVPEYVTLETPKLWWGDDVYTI